MDLDLFIKSSNLAMTVVVGLYVWLSNRNRVTHARITELQEKTSKSVKDLEDDVDRRLEGAGQQLARLEEALKQAPNRDELRQIHVRINEVSSQVTQLRGEFTGASNTLNMIHQHLLKGHST